MTDARIMDETATISCPSCFGKGGSWNVEQQHFDYCDRCEGRGYLIDTTPNSTAITEEKNRGKKDDNKRTNQEIVDYMSTRK